MHNVIQIHDDEISTDLGHIPDRLCNLLGSRAKIENPGHFRALLGGVPGISVAEGEEAPGVAGR